MSNVSTWLDNMAKGTGLNVNSDHAKQLLDMTMGIESQFGKYKKQVGGGPAEGIFQIEPSTRKDLLRYAQQRQPKIYRHLQSLPSGDEKDAVLARTKYWMSPNPIPEDDAGKAQYWKKNFQAGGTRGATAEQALARYQEGKKKPTVQESFQQPMLTPDNIVFPGGRIDTSYQHKIDRFRNWQN
ncbi:MAG: hypothetical protein DRI37_08760 [Chloroflexi bacterium]|nr:MAG: hypothetical protein DRI37_08760 [Chloroflexota bacterium]